MFLHARRHITQTSVLLLALLITPFCTTALAQQAAPEVAFRITYNLSMSRPASHLFEVNVEVEMPKAAEFVDFQMPRWSPGRYAVFDFAKNVQEVSAASPCAPQTKCDAPRKLHITRLDTQTWRVESEQSRNVVVSYKVFGDDLSGTFSQLNERHANYNGASVFMYVVNHKRDPVRLKINPPTGWRIVNGYTERSGQSEWAFANYDLLIDTPTEIAPDWTIDEFKVDGKPYRIVVHSFGNEGGKRPNLVRDIEKIVRAQTAMWGAPEFDAYTFLLHFAPDALSGDGMEHLTSTQIIETGALDDKDMYGDALDAASHEFFHVWNVKRLRPVELGPWDFTKPLATRALWIAEGITNYYGHLMMRRAGIWNDKQFYDSLGQTINGIENSPGSRLMSAEESSLVAPLLDGALHEQRTNLLNTAISYYPKGELLGLVLDLLIRKNSRGRASLDDVMRRMYEEFYVRSPKATYYLRGRGYTNEDFARVASEVAGIDLRDFFACYVRDTQTPPYDEAFAAVGLRLVQSAPRDKPERKEYRVEEVKDASPETRALRVAWLSGRKP